MHMLVLQVLAWLAVKFRRVQAGLAGHVAGMGSGHAAAYVLTLLGEYVGEPWLSRLAPRVGASTSAGATGCGEADREAMGESPLVELVVRAKGGAAGQCIGTIGLRPPRLDDGRSVDASVRVCARHRQHVAAD